MSFKARHPNSIPLRVEKPFLISVGLIQFHDRALDRVGALERSVENGSFKSEVQRQ